MLGEWKRAISKRLYIVLFFFPVKLMEVYMIWLINNYQSSLKKQGGGDNSCLWIVSLLRNFEHRGLSSQKPHITICVCFLMWKKCRGERWGKILPSNILDGFLDEQKVLKSVSLSLFPLMCNFVSCAQEEFVLLSLQVQSLQPHRAVLWCIW